MKKTLSPPSLTEKEKNILIYIESYLLEKGISPSYQEIKDHFGFASFNSVQNYLKQLLNKGYIAIPSNLKRAIQIIHSADTVQKKVIQLHAKAKSAETQTFTQKSKILPLQKSNIEQTFAETIKPESLSLPLLGKVAAGRPLESMSYDEYIDVPSSLVRNPSKSFALKISGDSMIEDGIHDGDVILVQKQPDVSNGEIVVATIDNESTIKRYFFRSHPEHKTKMVELQPANSTMTSMWFTPEQVQIQGILVGLIRKF